MTQRPTPCPDTDFDAPLARLILDSHRRVLGRDLLPAGDPRALYHADRIVLAHDGAADPVLTYGNLAAQRLWEMGWDQLTAMPSRLTAEPGARAQRDQMFQRMRTQGYVDDYHGVRISATGRRFEIIDAVIWPLLDAQGVKQGEAAWFDRYRRLD